MNTITSQTEEKSFREQISDFMDEYSKSIGFAEGFTSSLVSDSILKTIEDTIKNNKYTQLSSELTSSLGGLKEQINLSQMNTALGTLSKAIKVLPAVSLANSLYEDWQQGNDYPYETMKTALAITAGIIIGGWCGGLLLPAIGAGLVGSLIDNYWDDIKNKFDELLGVKDKLVSLFSTAEVTKSPLVVDLDGDGVETVGVSEGVYFDHDGNGFAEKSGWVGKDDGILVRDINNNGTIDNGTELFGNNSVLSSGENALNGFEALKELDSNKDGVFNSSDEAWNTVKVWKDSNQNGIVDNSELLSLEQANIAGINLNYNEQELVDGNGNTHAQTGTIIKTDGSSGTITDVWFDADTADTIDQAEVIIPDDIKSLPDVSGFGNVHSLQAAMALDESGELKALVEQFMSETNVSARNALLNDIIYHWAGVEDMDPFGRTPSRYNGTHYLDDARKLEALEEFMGRGYLGTWCWGERDPNPNRHAVLFIHDAFDELKEYVKNELLSQTHYKTLLEKVTLTYDAATESWDIDVSQAVAAFEEMFAADVLNTTLMMREFSEIISTYTDLGDEIIAAFNLLGDENGDIFERELFKFGKSIGTDGNDIIKDDDFGSIITGLGGNDKLYGNGGDDTIIGGAGNDYMAGGDGEDVYLFSKGFGNDEINTLAADGKKDVIEFDETIMPSNVSIGRQDFDLILTITYDDGTLADSIRVHSYFQEQGTSSATLAAIKFSDGTSWDYEYAITHWNSIPGIDGGVTMEGNDKANNLNGTAMDDILVGNGGNDTLDAKGGSDVLAGGKGDDILNGGQGDDAYVWNLGDGFDTIYDTSNNDTIVFGKGISFRDLVFRSVGQTLLILVDGDEQQGVKISSFFIILTIKLKIYVFMMVQLYIYLT